MSIRIALEDPPEFYTNLDTVRGRVLVSLNRYEPIGAIIVKLEGECNTALAQPGFDNMRRRGQRDARDTLFENHKVLYRVAQVFPDETASPAVGPLTLAPGQHQFPFTFKVPFNNMCSDQAAMARIGGLAGAGGYAAGSGILGLGGIRVMDGSKQLLYRHVTKTLPPSFTGFPMQAEVRYFVKVTIQRPGLFKENWRYQVGLKFLPIEPPRPPKSNQESYARRPFAFKPRSPGPLADMRKRTSFFGNRRASSQNLSQAGSSSAGGAGLRSPSLTSVPASSTPPSIEVSARLPHPSIITCNKPIPLRLLTKKLNDAPADVYLIALQIDLIGRTVIRTQQLQNTETTRWVIVSRTGLSIPVSGPDMPAGAEKVIPDSLWRDAPLPNTVMPSFVTCNLSRDYQLEVKVGLAWGKNSTPSAASHLFKGKSRLDTSTIPQEIHLPLHFTSVDVYSGLAPPAQLLEAMRRGRTQQPGRPQIPTQRPSHAASSHLSHGSSSAAAPAAAARPPVLPSRPSGLAAPQARPAAAVDPLYPPQLQPGDIPPYDDAPPSYDEAMADNAGPVFPAGSERPAYSGVTNENEPSMLPAKA